MNFLFFICFGQNDDMCYFFDVGQGHSSLFLIPERNTLALIDAGATKLPNSNTKNNTAFIKAEKIKTILNKHIKDDTKILVITTHPHKDHYNWLPQILTQSQLKMFVICGGHKNEYNDTFINWVKSVSPYEFKPKMPNPFFVSDHKNVRLGTINNLINKFLRRPTKLGVHLLCTPNTQKISHGENECSLVTKVSYGSDSFLVVGDAPGSVIQSISPDQLESFCLLASHHGANTGKCKDDSPLKTNSQSFFENAKDHYFIMSHDITSGYKHPSSECVFRAVENLPLDTVPAHIICHAGRTVDFEKDKNTYLRTFASIKGSTYYLSITNLAIFSTYINGTITFSTNKHVSWDKKSDNEPTDFMGLCNFYKSEMTGVELILPLLNPHAIANIEQQNNDAPHNLA